MLAVVLAACGSVGSVAPADPPEPTSLTDVEALLAASTTPVVLNVWASWCIPCRSEAPLLDAAAAKFSNDVAFVMLNVQDGPGNAARFIGEFFPDAAMIHLADRPGNVPIELGANRGVPLTFFYAAGGELVELHFGVIDERTLALQIDELLAR